MMGVCTEFATDLPISLEIAVSRQLSAKKIACQRLLKSRVGTAHHPADFLIIQNLFTENRKQKTENRLQIPK
jgi:hypothetical protein